MFMLAGKVYRCFQVLQIFITCNKARKLFGKAGAFQIFFLPYFRLLKIRAPEKGLVSCRLRAFDLLALENPI